MTQTDPVLFLVRGFPGSGRTTAIAGLKANIAGLITVSSDPTCTGDEYGDPEIQEAAVRRAANVIEDLTKGGTPHIALETAIPRMADLHQVLYPAHQAGYRIEVCAPAGKDPFDVFYCFENSQHQPNPHFLQALVAKWEEYQPAELAAPVVSHRAEVWSRFVEILRTNSLAEAEAMLEALQLKFPLESQQLRLAEGILNVRRERKRRAEYPLAHISPYWAAIKTGSRTSVSVPVAQDHDNDFAMFDEFVSHSADCEVTAVRR